MQIYPSSLLKVKPQAHWTSNTWRRPGVRGLQRSGGGTSGREGGGGGGPRGGGRARKMERISTSESSPRLGWARAGERDDCEQELPSSSTGAGAPFLVPPPSYSPGDAYIPGHDYRRCSPTATPAAL
jgi:hypothetical protein